MKKPSRSRQDGARGMPGTGRGAAKAPGGGSGEELSALLEQTRPQLLAAAAALKLRVASKATKAELARLVLQARREGAPRSEARAQGKGAKAQGEGARAQGDEARAEPGEPQGAAALGAVPLPEPARAAAARLDLGPAAAAGKGGEDIPWSYGQDRVTAMAVDPDTLYAYWEVTDTAIDRARAGLGAGGADAWLNVRVYDTSGVLFDGTNAHSYFDHGLARWDRQWFFSVGKPSSSAVVEVGLKSPEGYFVRIVRSGRVDFPRSEAAPGGDPEWLTVLAGGEPVPAGRGAPARPAGEGEAWPAGPGGGPGGGGPAGQDGRDGQARFEQIPLWLLFEGGGEGERRWREILGEGFERVEWHSEGGESWLEVQGRLEWQGEPVLSSWEAGPFSYPVHVDPPTRESWQGGSIAFQRGGVTHLVHGPWRVEIRNLGARSQRAVLGRWEIYRSWTSQGGAVREWAPLRGGPGGASERVAGSAWLGGSESRMGGASELWRLGASELRLAGASERMLRGASEQRLAGASERRLSGASEWRLGGASEKRLGGASEKRLGGASERRLAGASEKRLGGASEGRMGGASERRLGGASEGRARGGEPRPKR
jgi:uncharacterized protein